MLRLITDFDGPIIDVSERYYRVYQFCLEKTLRPNQALQELSKAEAGYLPVNIQPMIPLPQALWKHC